MAVCYSSPQETDRVPCKPLFNRLSRKVLRTMKVVDINVWVIIIYQFFKNMF